MGERGGARLRRKARRGRLPSPFCDPGIAAGGVRFRGGGGDALRRSGGGNKLSSNGEGEGKAAQRPKGQPPEVRHPKGDPEALMSAGRISVQEYMAMISNAEELEAPRPRSGVGMTVQRSAKASRAMAPPQNKDAKPDKSVRLSHATSGGMATGRVVNRFGKTEL